MDRIEYFDPNHHMEELLGSNSPGNADSDFMTTFLGSFAQRVGGPRQDPAAAVLLPLAFKANIFLLSGIPPNNKSADSTCRKPSFIFEKKLKFPTGALKLLISDRSFLSKFTMYVYEGQKKKMLKAVGHRNSKCGCCGKFADGFVTNMHLELPDMTSAEGVMKGPQIIVDPVFLACQNTVCNRKLREYGSSQLNSDETHVVCMCANDSCCKVEPENGPKFKVCSRCKMRYYCSRECQKADWQDHKKMCVPC